jgi:hypothetical protein
MAIYLTSQNFKYSEVDPSGTLTYIVSDEASAEDAATAVGYTPGDSFNNATDPFTGINMICQSVSVQSLADSVNAWTVTVELGTAQGLASFVTVQSDVGGTFVDVWRSTTVPSGGTPSGSDIAGTKLDSAGEPVSQFIWQTTLQISRRYNNSTNPVPWSTIWSNLGKRNSATLEGAAIGQLLFKGVKVSNIGKCVWEVQFDFVGDQFYHLRQVPTRESDGRVQLDANQAREVKWFQPFLNTANFYTMLGSYSVCAD